MKSGIIKVFRFSEGWAIIAPDEPGPDVFLHFSQIVDPRVRDRMCIGLQVLYNPVKDAKGWKAYDCRSDIYFTWVELPKEICCGNEVAVRDERDGTVEVFQSKLSARAWMTLRRGQHVVCR